MNTKQFFNDLVNNEELKDIPLKYIGRVALIVLKLIQENNYIYRIGD